MTTIKEGSLSFKAMYYSYGEEYIVKTHGGRWYTVNLIQRTCDYGESTLFQRPCKHILNVIWLSYMNLRIYVDPHFRFEAYYWTYLPKFHPLPDENLWLGWNRSVDMCDMQMLISKLVCRKVIIHNEIDSSSIPKQKKCGQICHNKRYCKDWL